MDRLPSFIPLIIVILFIRSIASMGRAASRKRSTAARTSQGTKPSSLPNNSKQTSTQINSAPPKPWQVGKHNVKPVLNGKAARGKAFGQRMKKSNYNSAFEDRGIFSGGSVSAFGDERDVISSGSMAAINREYIDVGNDYVSGFDVGVRRETPIGFDR